ncbi:hypothetical protein [Rhodococcus sp. NPDC060176]
MNNALIHFEAQPMVVVCGSAPSDARWGTDGSVDPPTRFAVYLSILTVSR